MNKQDKDYEELLALIEEQADDWFGENGFDEFEDTPDNPNHEFRFEYQMESLTNTSTTRFKKWSAE